VLPDHFEVDASSLAIGQGIHLKEITKKEGVRYLDDPEQMVVSVAVPMSEAKLEALLTSQAVGPEGAKEPEVEAKGKAAAEGVEGAAAAAAPGAPAPAAGAEAKPGEKKEGAAAAAAPPKAEKKEAEKKK
jgi:large subunit ribosomal protein L25